MTFLGHISDKEILYVNLRSNINWLSEIPSNNDWIAFTITDQEDVLLINDVVCACLDKSVRYTCSTGELASVVELSFDQEFVFRAVRHQELTGQEHDYSVDTMMTTSHKNFSEGFWFATTCAYNEPLVFKKVICLDFTKRGVKKHLLQLITSINNGWLPSDDENELPIYDDNC